MGRVIQSVTNVDYRINPPPLPDSDDITTVPYGNRANFCLAILFFSSEVAAKFKKTVLDAAWSAVRKKAPKEGKILQKMLMK